MSAEHTKLVKYGKPPEQTLQSILTTIDRVSRDIVRDVANDDIVIFLGNTKAGKSTVINYIIGNTLSVQENSNTYKMCIKTTNEALGPAIGTGALSETTLPSKWMSHNIRETMWDTPGFNDNRGVAQDIPNAFFIKELLNNAKSAKLVLVSDINDIYSDNLRPFIDFVSHIHTILPEIERLKDGVSVVFTKVPARLNRDKICTLLRAKIIEQTTIDVDHAERELVQHFIEHKDLIGIFKEVTEEYEAIEQKLMDDGIISAVHDSIALTKEQLSNVHLGISVESQTFLLETHNKLCEMQEFDYLLEKIQNIYFIQIQSIKDSLNAKMSDERLIQIKNTISDLQARIDGIMTHPKHSLFDILTHLASVNPEVGQAIIDSNIFMKEKFITFIEQILHLHHREIFENKITQVATTISTHLRKCDIATKCALGEITQSASYKLQEQLDGRLQQISTILDVVTKQLQQSNDEITTTPKNSLEVSKNTANTIITPPSSTSSGIQDDISLFGIATSFGIATAALLSAPLLFGMSIATGVAIGITAGGSVGAALSALHIHAAHIKKIQAIAASESDVASAKEIAHTVCLQQISEVVEIIKSILESTSSTTYDSTEALKILIKVVKIAPEKASEASDILKLTSKLTHSIAYHNELLQALTEIDTVMHNNIRANDSALSTEFTHGHESTIIAQDAPQINNEEF